MRAAANCATKSENILLIARDQNLPIPTICHSGMGITAMGTANAKASWMLLFPPCVIKARQRFNLEIWSGWFHGLRMAQGCENDDVFSTLDYTRGT